MKVSLNPSLSAIIISILMCSDLSFGIAQDIIKLNTGQELQVMIHDKNGRTVSYFLEEEDSCKLHVLSRNSIKWFRYEFLTSKRISFSFSFGAIPYGTACNIKDYMIDHGYGGSVSGWFGSVEYPKTLVIIPVLLEMEYLMKPPHGISVEFAASNFGTVTGLGNYNSMYPQIKYKNPQLSLSYKLYSRSFKSALQAGLIINFSTITNEVEESQIKMGFLIGYTGSLIEKETFFMRFQTQLRYIVPLMYTNEDLFMYNEKISLSHFFIGLQMGVKLFTDKS